jgi:hypothetical protein
MFPYLYKITADVTPLEQDCGLLCNSICCKPDASDSLGIYLYPGEEKMFSGNEDWLVWESHHRDEQLFPPSWPQNVYFVKCTKECPRHLRPLACRFFPLTPHITPENELLLIHETLPLPYKCPLIEKKISLQREFINRVAHCWQLMLKDPRIYDLVEEDSRDRDIFNQKVETVYNCGKIKILPK